MKCKHYLIIIAAPLQETLYITGPEFRAMKAFVNGFYPRRYSVVDMLPTNRGRKGKVDIKTKSEFFKKEIIG